MGESVSRIDEWMRERLEWEDWQTLLQRTIGFAEGEIRRRGWRGEEGGVLPGGQDANGVASEVIAAVLRGEGRLALGWTQETLEQEIRRLVRGQVRRMRRRREAGVMRSEWQILPCDEGGEPRSLFDEVAGVLPNGAEVAEWAEAALKLARCKHEILPVLDGDAVARGIFGCLCAGMVKRREIAAQLGVGVGAVSAGRRRLNRKLEEYGRKHPDYPRLLIEEMKSL
jgi:hypothetical protein